MIKREHYIDMVRPFYDSDLIKIILKDFAKINKIIH